MPMSRRHVVKHPVALALAVAVIWPVAVSANDKPWRVLVGADELHGKNHAPDIVRLGDGRMFMAFLDGHHHRRLPTPVRDHLTRLYCEHLDFTETVDLGRPYGSRFIGTWRSDEGATWTKPVVIVVSDGRVVRFGGGAPRITWTADMKTWHGPSIAWHTGVTSTREGAEANIADVALRAGGLRGGAVTRTIVLVADGTAQGVVMMKRRRMSAADLLILLLASTGVPAARGEAILQQGFDGMEPGASLVEAGWHMHAGAIRIGPAVGWAGPAIAGARAEPGVHSVSSRTIRQSKPLEKYVLSFRALATAEAHNSEFGFAHAGGDARHAAPLAVWTRSNNAWRFDVRGIAESKPGQRDLFPHVWPGGVDEAVACTIVIDAGGHWVWGTITAADGTVHRTRVFGLPHHQVGSVDALYLVQDARPGSGPIDIDDIRVTCTEAPPIVGTSPDDWRLPEITIVEYSWTSADTTFIRDNIAMMERLPLDGITVRIPQPRFPHGTILSGIGRGDVGWEFFQGRPFEAPVFEAALADIEATGFTRFRRNFVNMITYLPGKQTVDWFDDRWWEGVLDNTRRIADFARRAGCAGVMFDPEEYGCRIWGLPGLMADDAYAGRTADAVIARVRQRGRQFMQAFNGAFPDPKFYVLHAWEDVLSRTADDFERLRLQYRSLTIPFLDGMLEGSTDDTIIMDGIENGYYVDELAEFRIMTDRVRRYGPLISAVPDLFRRKVRCATGTWLDMAARFDPVNHEKNWWTPAQYEQVITNALRANDGFVWLYLERPSFWLASPDAALAGGVTPATGVGEYAERNTVIKWLPAAYVEAIRRARRTVERDRAAAAPVRR